MNLNFPLLDGSIRFSSSTFLVVEDITMFAHLIKLFYSYPEKDELKLFDQKQNEIKSSELLLITDILDYDLNSASVIKLIYADLSGQINEKPEVKTEIEKSIAAISELIEVELLEHELDLEQKEITLTELFKMSGVKIETKSDTIFEKTLEIIQVYKYLGKKKLLVFCNICSYLTQPELKELSEYISLNGVTVLFIEPRKVYNFPQFILDEDYFLNLENMV
ncbi:MULTISPECIES: type II-A CRISPR-associated protein Csn2 [unclassified Enterococcus]|uniref:type II-A CRISPR-associated protein Csn2 n=1 Tax=unclassified Enterococcus TaxID=2608891 RepID=UPI003D2CC1DB